MSHRQATFPVVDNDRRSCGHGKSLHITCAVCSMVIRALRPCPACWSRNCTPGHDRCAVCDGKPARPAPRWYVAQQRQAAADYEQARRRRRPKREARP